MLPSNRRQLCRATKRCKAPISWPSHTRVVGHKAFEGVEKRVSSQGCQSMCPSWTFWWIVLSFWTAPQLFRKSNCIFSTLSQSRVSRRKRRLKRRRRHKLNFVLLIFLKKSDVTLSDYNDVTLCDDKWRHVWSELLPASNESKCILKVCSEFEKKILILVSVL